MIEGLLLDTHILLWLEASGPLNLAAKAAISEAGRADTLYLSEISIWEIGVAFHRKAPARRPDLRGFSTEAWLERMQRSHNLQSLPITREIAFEAAAVPGYYGYGDPGDCFLIATARRNNLTLATHDGRILELAARNPDYLSVFPC